MRKQLEQIRVFEGYILRQLSAEEKLLLDAKMILSPTLKHNFQQQYQLHKIVLKHGRERLRNKLVQLHERLMGDDRFASEIHSYFK